jgi:tetratricopeptide (TPR) repeat protein
VRVFLKIAAIAALSVLANIAVALAASQDPGVDCLSDDNDRRISGCSALIAIPGLPREQLSLAHGLRALAYSLRGRYEEALVDYDKAIGINPNFAVALNNRAWLHFKLGRLQDGTADVERALKLAPESPYALDTRAHIHQAQGATPAAIADYERAMQLGGQTIVKLYQCGLRSRGLYSGALDGVSSSALTDALRTCASDRSCDPLPADQDCAPTVS